MAQTMHAEQCRGLTLVELVIASTIMGMLALGLGAFINVCVESHQLSMREARVGRAGVLTLERIGAGLRYCDVVTTSSLSWTLEFDEESLATRTYTYDEDADTLTETVLGDSMVLVENVANFSMPYDSVSKLISISLTIDDGDGKTRVFSDKVYCRNIDRRWGERVQ